MPEGRCPACRKPVDAGTAQCPYCGAPVPHAPARGAPLENAYIRTETTEPIRYEISEGTYPKTERIETAPSPETELLQQTTQSRPMGCNPPAYAKKKGRGWIIPAACLAVLAVAAALVLVLHPFGDGRKEETTPLTADGQTTGTPIEPGSPIKASTFGREGDELPDEPDGDPAGDEVIGKGSAPLGEKKEEAAPPADETTRTGGLQIGPGYHSVTPTPAVTAAPAVTNTPVKRPSPTTTATSVPASGGSAQGQGGSRLDSLRANRRMYMTTKGKRACFVEVETAAAVNRIRIIYPGNEVYRESTMPAAANAEDAFPKKWKIEISFFSKETRNQVTGTYTIVYYTGSDEYEEQIVWGSP